MMIALRKLLRNWLERLLWKLYPVGRNPHRPQCPNCGRELIFAAIVVGGDFFSAWLCDCGNQPEGIVPDIVRAREWDEQALVYVVREDDD